MGTAGWTDKGLVDCGKFYPADFKSPEERLRYYASLFPMVEIDSSYYGMPSEQNAHLWVERTPASFLFNVKAFRIFTGHQTPVAAIPKDIREALPPSDKKNVYYKDVPEELRLELWGRFRKALQPLREAGKLCAIHFQFPPWAAFHRENFEHIQECRSQLPDYHLAVEFRNGSWFTEKHCQRTLDFERELGLVNVVVDEPQGIPNTIPSVWAVTQSDLAIVRMHGRNAEMWNRKGLRSSAERFNYDYSEAELRELAQPVHELAGQVRQTQVIFNNNHEDQGQRNGQTMMKTL